MKARIGGQTVDLEIEGRVLEGRASGGTTDHIHRHKLSDLTTGGVGGVAASSRRKCNCADKARSASSNAAPPFTFTLSGQIRGGKNNMKVGRNGKHYPDKTFAKWRDEAVNDIYQHSIVFRKPTMLEIEVHYAAGDLRRRDIPGMLDALFHVLERAQVVEDDAQIKEAHWYQEPLYRANPGVRVTLREVT